MDHPHSRQDNITNISPILSPQNDQSVQTRSPLSNRANLHVGTTTTWEHKDSSEGQPSTHDSICDAAWVSTSDVAKSPYQTPGRPVTPPRSLDFDLESESPLSRLETPFLYGYGTELAPILEQRSIATLRTKGSMSTSDLSSLLHDAPGTGENIRKARCKSDDTTVQLRQQHSHQGLNFDDIVPKFHLTDQLAQPNPQLKCLAYSRPTVHVVDVHAYPRKPIYPPPQQPTTPPSLKRISYPMSEGNAYIESTSPRGIAYEAPDFRSLRSGHGNLSAHPFVQQVASGKKSRSSSQRVPSRGVRGREDQWARPAPNTRYFPPRARHDSLECADEGYLAWRDVSAGICRNCHHPRDEIWSLGATLTGYGPGMRPDWCTRCACRKIFRLWCCGE
ncbi:hypothetical protein GGS21DRAFT_285983 [Xylaria nigripes]|nr:hypothetical protein GGS21DRAFT_285983 [Xylaria nigripes]